MKITPLSFVIILCTAFALPQLTAQENLTWEMPDEVQDPPPPPEAPPRQFRDFVLGMALDTLKTALESDSLFTYRGDRDVSFLPIRQETLVETSGLSFIRRAHFQLADDGAVFIMSFTLDTRLIDHFSLFTSFVNKYGQPIILNPSEAVWEDDQTRVSIERPLTVKYIDRGIFDRLREESRTRADRQTVLREEFLADF